MARFKFRFRVTLLTILVVLSGFIAIAMGINSFVNERRTAHLLAGQVLDQTSLRIYDQLQNRLHEATAHVDLFRHIIESGRVKADNFTELATVWIEEMESRAAMSRYSIGLEQSGEWMYVRRVNHGRVGVGELRRDSKTGRLGLKNYWAEDFPAKPFSYSPNADAEDPRLQPWYIKAKETGGRVWTETYLFFGAGNVRDIPGISCAVPIKKPDGSLLAVITASLDLESLCRFLQSVPIGYNGFSFVVERRHDGSRRLVGYPDPNVILHEVDSVDGISRYDLVPVEKCPDARVQEFLKHLPQDFAGEDRPVAINFDAEGKRYLGSYHLIPSRSGPRGAICVVLPEMDVMAGVYRTQLSAAGIGVSVLLLGILISLWVSRQVAHPLEGLAVEADLVGQFRVQPKPAITSIVLEVDRLGRATEAMKASLRSFRKYVPADLVRNLIASSVEARLGGEERELTILFCDLAGFTSISEGLKPQALVEQLGEYFRAFTEEISASGGTVDKFIGDAVMAFWGAPLDMPNHAEAACRAAVRCQERLSKLRDAWRSNGQPEFYARIGLNTGTVVVGNIGSEQRLNYTVIGDSVNVASRLESLNKHYCTSIIVSDTTYRAAAESLLARPLDRVAVKGKKEGGMVYELIGLQGESTTDRSSLLELYGRALDAYRSRDWLKAAFLFEQVLQFHPGDGPATEMLRRCQRYQSTPPAATWDGVFQMDSK